MRRYCVADYPREHPLETTPLSHADLRDDLSESSGHQAGVHHPAVGAFELVRWPSLSHEMRLQTLRRCCCILPSVLLPSYESSDPSPQNADFQRILSSGVCLCGRYRIRLSASQTAPLMRLPSRCSSFGDLKKTQDPTKYLDGPLEPSVVVPIKAAEARAGLSRGVQY